MKIVKGGVEGRRGGQKVQTFNQSTCGMKEDKEY